MFIINICMDEQLSGWHVEWAGKAGRQEAESAQNTRREPDTAGH